MLNGRLNRRNFFKKYHISDVDFRKTGLKWEDLVKIYIDYHTTMNRFEPVASLVAGWLRHIPEAHTIRSRIKDPEHLIEKIVRVSKEKQKPCAMPNNYLISIKDLIGVRILHRFKEEWDVIHDEICYNFQLDAKPEAYFGNGDPSWLIDACRKKGCEIKVKDDGYRSIHYPIILKIGGKNFFVEIQVRTLFEEAWGEVNHHIRYPYLQDDFRLRRYFVTCAAASGLADELSSIAKLYKQVLELRSEESDVAYKMILELSNQIDKATNHLAPLLKKFGPMIRDLSK